MGYEDNQYKGRRLGFIMLFISGVLILALSTDGFDVTESAGRPIDGMLDVPNLLGGPGAFIAGILAVLVGDASHLIYAITIIWMIKLFIKFPFGRVSTRLLGMLFVVFAGAGLLHINVEKGFSNAQPGGVFGDFLAEQLLLPWFGTIGANVMGAIVVIIGLLLATDFLFIHFVLLLHRLLLGGLKGIWSLLRGFTHGLLWLFGTHPFNRSPQEEYASVAVGDLSAMIPETLFPPDSPKKRNSGFASRAWAFLMPRVSAPESDGYCDYTSSQVPLKKETKATPNSDNTASDLPAQKKRPWLRRHSSQNEAPSEAPFGDIPELNTYHNQESRISEFEEQGELFSEVCPSDTPAQSPGRKIEALSPEEDTPADGPDDVDCKVSLRHEAVAAKSVSTKSGGTRLRRRPVDEEEVPDDYQYPEKYTPPPIDLFRPAERHIIPNLSEKMGKKASRLEETLRTFNLEAKVTDITRGPTVTRFELEPAPGMKVSRFQGLRDDIALALKAKGVRIEAPIPGKGRVGIEVSNDERDPVVIRELLEDPVFNAHSEGLQLALGKGITGDVCIADLTRMPHLLVAGATGAGKTVCIKALLASLLYRHSPDELQLMLVDPKMVELFIFNEIPHLITPVVTDPKKAASALQWLITEMEERYRLFRDLRVRNIDVYNASVENGEIEMEGAKAGRKSRSLSVVRKLPYIVCIIDELADLMVLARADVEEAIMRLAQLARAVGIHLIIATQRPSVDVLTGVIKANFPARISFQVSSRVDSRCILDEIGAENLVGLGDMLFMPAGQKPSRIQGAFVSDAEMRSLIAYLKRQAPPQYRDEIEKFGKSKDAISEINQEEDPYLEDAIRVVLETKQASISMVQRRLRVGYTRAARLIDMMELKGIVGPHTGSKAREILVDQSDIKDVEDSILDLSEDDEELEEDLPEEDEAE